MSATPMVSVLSPIVNETIRPSNKSVPVLVCHDRAGSCTSITEIKHRSCSAPSICAAATDEAYDQHQYHRACKGHDDLADNRMADDHELDVEKAREEAPQKRSQDSHDDVAEEAEPVAKRNAAGQEAGHEPHQAPDQDRAPVQVDRVSVDGDRHLVQALGADCRMRSHS